jgi:hypothetical protein
MRDQKEANQDQATPHLTNRVKECTLRTVKIITMNSFGLPDFHRFRPTLSPGLGAS